MEGLVERHERLANKQKQQDLGRFLLGTIQSNLAMALEIVLTASMTVLSLFSFFW